VVQRKPPKTPPRQDPKRALDLWHELEQTSSNVHTDDFTILRNHFLANVKVPSPPPPPTLARKINSSSSFPCTPNPGFFLSSMAPLPLGGEVGLGQTPSPKGPPTGRGVGPSADPCNRCGYSPNRWPRTCEPSEYICHVFLPPTLAPPPGPSLVRRIRRPGPLFARR